MSDLGAPVRVFVYEFVTGGGMVRDELPPRLVREADLMLHTLLADLADIPGLQLVTSRDARLAPVPGVEQVVLAPDEDPFASFCRGAAGADAVWPTAPETAGTLERLARSTVDLGRILLGSRPDAIQLCGSKSKTAGVLGALGIPVVETYIDPGKLPNRPGRWVVKPDDGAGSEGLRLVPDWTAARSTLATLPGRLVAQPWVEGDPRSLSVLCASGRALLLSVNQQHLRGSGAELTLTGLSINALTEGFEGFADLAARIAAAIPGLWGYVGVDFIQTDAGPLVLEVNPRLTTSFCGLRAALGLNVAAQVLDLWRSAAPCHWQSRPRGRRVEIGLEPSDDQ